MVDVIAPQLAPDETELRRSAARARFPKRVRGADVFRGEVVLTDQRLVFAPRPSLSASTGLELVLGDIVEVRPWRASAWPWARAGFELTTRLGPQAAVQILVSERDAWCDAIGAARSDFRGRTDLSGWLTQAGNTGGPSPSVLRALERTLVTERAFPSAHWHPEDAHSLAAVLREAARDLGLPDDVLDDAFIAGLVASHADGAPEDVLRQRQLADAAARMNDALAEVDSRRLHAFARDLPGLEGGSPVFWALCSDDEAQQLLGLGVVRLPS